jgi:catechol 2,3-dioxygenase-like lactoylglutathione lyase family enzyme
MPDEPTEVRPLRQVAWSATEYPCMPVPSSSRGRIVAMSARISCVCIDAVEPRPVADFWAAVLGWEVVEDDDEGISLASPGGELPTLDVLRVPEAKQVKNRLHLDLRADRTSFDAEVVRLEDLGARRVDVGQGPEVTWVVFADPDGNEFCLLRRTVQEVMAERT